MTMSGSKLNPDFEVIIIELPLQYEENGFIAVLAEASEHVNTASTSVFGLSAVLNLILGASLSSMLGQIKVI